jgi:hypothetical protein
MGPKQGRDGLLRLAAALLGLGLGVIGVGTAEAATRVVPTSPGCPTIKQCVEQTAQTGDLVVLRGKNGSGKPNDAYYEQDITIDKRLTISGDCAFPDTTTLDAAPNGDPGGDGFIIAADNVTIRCLRIRHGGVGISNDVGYTGLRISYVTFASQKLAGVFLDNGADGYIVENSRFLGAGFVAVEADDSNGGRVVGNFARGSFAGFSLSGDNLTVDRNRLENNVIVGIELSGAAPSVNSNRVTATAEGGIAVACEGSCAGRLIQGNVVDGATQGIGIDIFGEPATGPGTGLRVQTNQVTNSFVGLVLDGEDVRATGNRAVGNAGSASGSPAWARW